MTITKKNKRFLESIGVMIDNVPRCHLTINPVNNAGFNIRTPITFTMGEKDLEQIVSNIKRLGFPGKRVVRALSKAIDEMTPTDLSEIKNSFWCVGYTPEDIIRYAIDVFKTSITYHGFQFIPLDKLDKSILKHFVYSFGGYAGVQRLFRDVIEKTIDEFRRIRKAEDVINRNKIESEISSDSLGSIPLSRACIKTQCASCKHCYIDRLGYRICLRKAVPVPKDLTIAEINAMYPSGRIYDCNMFKSRYILHEVHSCKNYVKRSY